MAGRKRKSLSKEEMTGDYKFVSYLQRLNIPLDRRILLLLLDVITNLCIDILCMVSFAFSQDRPCQTDLLCQD